MPPPANGEGNGNEGQGNENGKEAPTTTLLKVYGKDVEIKAGITGDEAGRILELAQKGAASDQRMQENATERKQLEEDKAVFQGAVELREAMKKLQQVPGDPEALQVLGREMGWSAEEQASISEMVRTQNAPAAGKAAPVGNSAPERASGPVKLSDLSPDLQKQLKGQMVEKFEDETKKALANHKGLHDNLQKGGDKRKESILEMLRDAVKHRMFIGTPGPAGQYRRQSYGPEVIQDALRDVETRVGNLGIPDGGEQLPAGQAGVGRLAPGTSTRHPTQPPKRVAMTDSKYPQYLQDRLQWEQLKGK